MSENINSEALDRLLELDGQFYDKPDLVRMARIRADVLHASAAWGSSEDGALINALADEVERLHSALEAERLLLEKTKWALQDAVSTNAENCRQRDWWKHAHGTVEAELTANERKVDALLVALEAAANALAWAERRMACPAYAEVIANDERNARAALLGDAA